MKLLLKLEHLTDPNINFEKEVSTTKANEWEEITFDYSTISTTNAYQKIVLIFDLGTVGDGSANFTFYMDDFRLTDAMPNSRIDLPVTFDVAGVNYTVTDFGNNQTVDAVDPTNPNNNVKKTTKVNGAETWAGTTIGTNTGFATAIPLTAAGFALATIVPATWVACRTEPVLLLSATVTLPPNAA